MIAIVDYGLGNVRAFLNVYKRLNIEASAASNADALRFATKIILPGVGSFDRAMQRLEQSGMLQALEDVVLRQGTALLGVCVGMQMLARSSDEGSLPGLGWIEGRVRGFASLEPACFLPLPHMGWNDVRPLRNGGLFDHLESNARFYFLHSFYFECDREENVLAVAHYGQDFSCAVRAARQAASRSR